MSEIMNDPLAPYRLTPQQIRDMMAERHGTLLGDDDPLLMYVTLHNAFLDQYDGVLNRHGQAVTSFLKKLSAEYAGEIDKHKKAMLSKAVRANMENTVREIVMHKTAMNELRTEIQHHKETVKLGVVFNALLTFVLALALTWFLLGGAR